MGKRSARERARFRQGNSNGRKELIVKPVRKCDECGHRKTDVTKVADPYAAEVNKEQWMRWLCDNCQQDRADEI